MASESGGKGVAYGTRVASVRPKRRLPFMLTAER